MNCREAEQNIFAERDSALDHSQRAALMAHLAQCPSCRQMHAGLTNGMELWQESTRHIQVPDAELEWQKLRREIRGGAGSKTAQRGTHFGWFALPLAAAAAAAITFFVSPSSEDHGSGEPSNTLVAHAKIEASVENASPVVFVDDKSGWVFVWADESKTI